MPVWRAIGHPTATFSHAITGARRNASFRCACRSTRCASRPQRAGRPPLHSTVHAMFVGQLLRYAASRSLLDRREQTFDWRFDSITDREFRWAIEAGLGPLIYHATKDYLKDVPPAWLAVLVSADVTAQLRHGVLVDTAIEVIDCCVDIATRVTLLKGISTSQELYPAPHMRPMSDIDVMIPAERYDDVESALMRRGYLPKADYPIHEGQHHGAPLYHPRRKVWVHRALFPDGDQLVSNSLFSSSQILAQRLEYTFHGRSVNLLSRELQLLYVTSSWVKDLAQWGIAPTFLISLFDTVYLLDATRNTLDWSKLLAWLDNELATAALYITLGYVASRSLGEVPPSVVPQLARRQRLVDRLQLTIIHAVFDRYLIGGRSWNFPFHPPTAPGRYSIRLQWEKRVVDRVRSKRKAAPRKFPRRS